MGSKSPIEWLEGGGTWNFLYGCTKCAVGCTHCYAERVVPRLAMRAVGPILGSEDGASGPANYRGQVILREDHLDDADHWRKPRKVFVNSLSDTFHPAVPESLLDRTWKIMLRARRHTFILLTKRPGRMYDFLYRTYKAQDPGLLNPWPHVWGGFSASDQASFEEGIAPLRNAQLALRILSLEPLVGPIDLRGRLDGIGWVIVGGESGRLARPIKEQWIRAIVKACQAARVPVFVKQMGAWWATQDAKTCPPYEHDTRGGWMPAWPEDLRVREVPRD